MTLIGVLLCIIGTLGALGSILFGTRFVGQWAMALAVVFVTIAVTGVLLIKPQR